jgi:very-short-patch-repair endonuclease
MSTPTPWDELTQSEKRARLLDRATESEIILRGMLNTHRRTIGRFEFQSPIQHYFADFLFKREKLIVELDGAVHRSTRAKIDDARRTRHLNRAGYRVLRFWNGELRKSPGKVLVQILNALDKTDGYEVPLEQAVYLPQEAAEEIIIDTRPARPRSTTVKTRKVRPSRKRHKETV